MTKEPNGFNFRSFVSLLLFLSFSGSAISGLILFLRPEGSLANWLGWSALGLDKKHWEAGHAVLVLVFFATALVHLLFNWRVFMAQLRRKKTRLLASSARAGLTGEFISALALISLILAGTLLRWSPFSSVAKLRSAIKDGKYVRAAMPPAADADRLTVAALCAVAGISQQQALRNAGINGVQIDSLSQTVAEVAKRNRLTPEKVFLLLKGD